MPHDEHQMVRKIIDYCDARWVEADKSSNAPYPTPDTQIGKKAAYNDVMHYARSLLIVSDSDPPESR